jgi:hypothetical protein
LNNKNNNINDKDSKETDMSRTELTDKEVTELIISGKIGPNEITMSREEIAKFVRMGRVVYKITNSLKGVKQFSINLIKSVLGIVPTIIIFLADWWSTLKKRGVRKHRKLMTGLALILGFIIVMFLITNRYTYITDPKLGNVYKVDKITGKTWFIYRSKMWEVKESNPSPGLFSRFSTFIQEIGQGLIELIPQGEKTPFPANLLEVSRNIGLTQFWPYLLLQGSIYNKSESDTATDIVIRFYYDKGDVRMNTEERTVRAVDGSVLSVEPELTEQFRVELRNAPADWDKYDYEIISAKISQ